MTITIVESGMTFGPYPSDDCFEIESSSLYKQLGDGVKTAEFALLRRPANKPVAVWIVEAKRSTPQPGSRPNFDALIDAIRQKLCNALQLVFAARLGRHPGGLSELPEGFKTLTLLEDWRLVLVIQGHAAQWLAPLNDALKNALRSVIRTFGLGPTAVAVLNDQMAPDLGLIV